MAHHLISIRAAAAAATLCLLKPLPLHAEVKATTTIGRVPDTAPLRPTVDSGANTVQPAEPLASTVTTIDLADAPQGLELSVAGLPNLKIRVSGNTMAALTDQHKGALIELVSQYRKSADLATAFERIDAAGATLEIEFAYYYRVRDALSDTFSFFFDRETGFISYRNGSDDTHVAPGSIVTLTVNDTWLLDPDNYVYGQPNAQQFAQTVVHELTHLILPGKSMFGDNHSGPDEAETVARSAVAYDALFQASGFDQLANAAAPERLAGLAVQGTASSDVITGSGRNDSITGGAGDDTLYGAEGSDTLVGALGNDILFGGPGENLLDGGAGNDRYEAQGDYDLIMDEGGTNDRLVARDVDLQSARLYRIEDTLFILKGNGGTIHVDRQWLPDNRIEYFELGSGTYTWQTLQQLPIDEETPNSTVSHNSPSSAFLHSAAWALR